jgi:hypothetical protein
MIRHVVSRQLGAILLAMALPSSADATDNKFSPQQFDLACAVVAGANLGQDTNEGRDSSMLVLLTFYLGRLSARDDTKAWNRIALGRVAELQEKALDSRLRKSCIDLYLEKTQQ